MNPESNKFEPLNIKDMTKEEQDRLAEMLAKVHGAENGVVLIRPDGSPVPKHWSVFTVGEKVVIKNYTFKVAYIGESNILFEPVGPVLIGEKEPDKT